jgi:hypothetical protein
MPLKKKKRHHNSNIQLNVDELPDIKPFQGEKITFKCEICGKELKDVSINSFLLIHHTSEKCKTNNKYGYNDAYGYGSNLSPWEGSPSGTLSWNNV